MLRTEGILELLSGDELERELRIRRSPWIFKTVSPRLVEDEIADDWEVVRTNRSSVRLRKAKPIDDALEDEVWALLARLGFTEMSAGRHFTIPVTVEGHPASKQIDVLAADDETALVVECKAAGRLVSRSMAKDLGETHGLKGAVTAALRQQYGIKKRIGWLYASRHIVWGRADLSRADAFKIRVLTENDLEYFGRLADLLGVAARHQLQAEVFGDQQIEGLNRTVPAVRGRIGGKRFYQFTIEPDRLLKIGFISHRLHLDADSVGAYQRMLKAPRLREIRAYIDAGGVFPTNVVVNFRGKRRFQLSTDKPEGDVNFGTLILPNTYKSAWIIDGQHRLYGFAGSKWAKSTQLPVLAFEGLPPAEEARMFVDINNKQVKVPRNLIVDLMSELYWDSPVPIEALHALLSRVVAVMGTQVGSPLRGRVVQEGERQTPSAPLTVTGVYEALNKSELIGTVRKRVFHPGPLYDTDSKGAVRRTVDVLAGYLGLFANALPDHWARGNGEGGYLCTNNGITALIIVLERVVSHLDQYGGAQPWQQTPGELVGAIAPYADPVIELFRAAGPGDIRHFRRQVGNVGQGLAAFGMMEAISRAKPGFAPEGLAAYISSQDETGTIAARQLMPKLQLRILEATLRLLRTEFGDDETGWWRRGVPEKVRTEVAARREASPEPGKIEQFFELLDYRAIAADHWILFEPFFAIGEGHGKDGQLAWFSKLNALRNRIAHPERGTVSEEELAFIESVMAHFEETASSLPS
jgi:DNA sulfur modification protein DndB